MTTTTLQTSTQTAVLGSTVILVARVNYGTANPVRYGSVTFYDDGQIIASVILNPDGAAATPYKPMTRGVHTLIAVYPPSSNSPFAGSQSAPLSLSVITLK